MNREPDPTAVLRDEHRRILQVLDILEQLLVGGLTIPAGMDRLEACIGFLRLYADACHHAKEEDILFPEMERELPEAGGLVRAMLEEHREARRLLAIMHRVLPGARKGSDAELDALHEAGHDYIHLLRSHIAREDGGLFEMADGALARPACARVCAAYERCRHSPAEGHTEEDLERMAEIILGASG